MNNTNLGQLTTIFAYSPRGDAGIPTITASQYILVSLEEVMNFYLIGLLFLFSAGRPISERGRVCACCCTLLWIFARSVRALTASCHQASVQHVSAEWLHLNHVFIGWSCSSGTGKEHFIPHLDEQTMWSEWADWNPVIHMCVLSTHDAVNWKDGCNQNEAINS